MNLMSKPPTKNFLFPTFLDLRSVTLHTTSLTVQGESPVDQTSVSNPRTVFDLSIIVEYIETT